MLQPSRRKYRKEQKGRNKGISHERGTAVSFGEYGLKAVGRGRITARQIEAARRAIYTFQLAAKFDPYGGVIVLACLGDAGDRPAQSKRTDGCQQHPAEIAFSSLCVYQFAHRFPLTNSS